MYKLKNVLTKPFKNKKAAMDIEDQAIEKSGNKGLLVIVIVLVVAATGFMAPKIKGYINEMKTQNGVIDTAISAAK